MFSTDVGRSCTSANVTAGKYLLITLKPHWYLPAAWVETSRLAATGLVKYPEQSRGLSFRIHSISNLQSQHNEVLISTAQRPENLLERKPTASSNMNSATFD